MEPIIAASTFATIVGLIGQFRSERYGHDQAHYNDFLEWLLKRQHTEIKELIEGNRKTSEGIRAFLQEDITLVLDKLQRIDHALHAYASAIPGLDRVASSLCPETRLSAQSLQILRELDQSGASKIVEYSNFDGLSLHIDDQYDPLELSEPRFIQDDLRSLVELRLLRLEQDTKDRNVYIFTRTAAELVCTGHARDRVIATREN